MKKAFLLISALTIFINSFAGAESAYKVLDNSIRNYKNIRSYSSNVALSMSLKTQGVENKAILSSMLYVQKPNKFKIENLTDTMSRTIVSDGINKYEYLPEMKSYTSLASSDRLLKDLKTDFEELEILGRDNFLIFSFWDKNAKKWTLDNSTESIQFNGEEIVSDITCNIIEFKNKDDLFFRLWIDTETYIIHKIFVDLSPIIQRQHINMGIDTPNISMECEETHSEIEIDSKIPSKVFEFKVPDDAVHIDSFYEGMEQETDYPYLGRKIAEMEFQKLGTKTKFKTARLKTPASVVAFLDASQSDFTQQLYDLSAINRNFSSEKLTVLIVDCSANLDILKQKIEQGTKKPDIYHDSKQEAKDNYNIGDYPVIFIIDEDRIIKQIYTSYFPGLRERMQEDLEEQLGITKKQDFKENKERGLQLLWHLPIKTQDLFCYGSDLKVLTPIGEIYTVSASGNIKKVIKTKISATKILPINTGQDIILYRPRTTKFRRINKSGKTKWRKNLKQSVNNIFITDLDQDAKDEIIVGGSGFEGLIVFDELGDTIWQSTSTLAHNVWKVSAGQLDNSTKELEIAYISNNGDINVANGITGRHIKTIRTEIYANYLKVFENKKNNDHLILCSGNSEENEVLQMLDSSGKLKWELILGFAENSRLQTAVKHPYEDLIAASTADGQIFIFDKIGNIAAYLSGKGMYLDLDWYVNENGQTYLISANLESGLSAYMLMESD